MEDLTQKVLLLLETLAGFGVTESQMETIKSLIIEAVVCSGELGFQAGLQQGVPVVLERLRKEWSEAVAVMMRTEPRKRKARGDHE